MSKREQELLAHYREGVTIARQGAMLDTLAPYVDAFAAALDNARKGIDRTNELLKTIDDE